MTRAALKHGLSLDDLELMDPAGSDEEFEARAQALADRLSKAAGPVRRRDPNVGREHVNPPAALAAVGVDGEVVVSSHVPVTGHRCWCVCRTQAGIYATPPTRRLCWRSSTGLPRTWLRWTWLVRFLACCGPGRPTHDLAGRSRPYFFPDRGPSTPRYQATVEVTCRPERTIDVHS